VLRQTIEASREGTQHLISLGHRRITLLASDPDLRNIKERIQGYREALYDANLSKSEQIVVADRNDNESLERALEPILLRRARPSALLAVTQVITLGALKLISQLGLDLPKDISLLAFDDSEWLTALRPFVSTVSQPADEFADEAWAMLMTRLSKDRSPKLHSEVRCTLIPRESTAPPQGNKPIVTLNLHSGIQKPRE
jgi:LacI family transcriptional regulator